MSQLELSECANVSQGAISNLELRGSASNRSAQMLADCLEVNVRWLTTGEGPMTIEESQATIEAFVVPLLSDEEAIDWESSHKKENLETVAFALLKEKRGKNMFAIIVKGASMNPRFFDGDTLLVDPERTPINDDFVLVKTANQKTVLRKIIVETDGLFVKCLNPDFGKNLDEITSEDVVGVISAKQETF